MKFIDKVCYNNCINKYQLFNQRGGIMEKIAMWGGIAGIVIAIFAIVILYLTRSNIIDLLDRDVVMYDKNYQLKKESLQEAFDCLDLIAQSGIEIKANSQFVTRAKEAYNGLLCSVNNPKLYQEFYSKAIDPSVTGFSTEDIEKFKISCRSELIAKRKGKSEGFKGTTTGNLSSGFGSSTSQRPLSSSMPTRPTQPRPTQPVQRPPVNK